MKAEAWLILKPAISNARVYPHGHQYEGQCVVVGARVSRMTQSKPSLQSDEVATKIEIDVDEAWFLDAPLMIKATVPPPPSASAPIQATAETPIKGRAKSPATGAIRGTR